MKHTQTVKWIGGKLSSKQILELQKNNKCAISVRLYIHRKDIHAITLGLYTAIFNACEILLVINSFILIF
jgi:hypothetical protein